MHSFNNNNNNDTRLINIKKVGRQDPLKYYTEELKLNFQKLWLNYLHTKSYNLKHVVSLMGYA